MDADEIAREVVQPGRWAYRRIIAAFGKRVCNSDGTIDRVLLRRMIFEDPLLRRRLNAATHPSIVLEIIRQIAFHRLVRWRRLVVLDAPLLFETRLNYLCRYVVVVSCSEDLQTQRLMARDHVSKEVAHKSIHAQMPLTAKMRLADCVIVNDSSLELLAERVGEVYAVLLTL